MAAIFDIQGFGALSERNGQFSSASANQAFQSIASLGSNSIELTTRIWTQSGTSTAVFADPAKTESDASLLAGFHAAQAAGLSVVFKAMLSPLNGAPVSSLAPSDVGSFFASYKAEIVHLATVAQAGGVEIFAIGNEMSSLSGAQYRGYWTDLIAAVREVFHGELTYAAATDEASHVGFWDQLDVIGVNTYPPLTSSTTPTVPELVQAWSEVPFNPYYAAAFENKSPIDFLHGLSEQYGRPVLMTEVGYRSMDGTAIRPGGWTADGTVDVGEQADAYNAFFQVWTAHGGSWLKGVEFWQWDLNNQYSPTGYSVMGKPAEAVVAQYFHGGGLMPGLTEVGSPGNDLIDIGRGNDVVDGGLGDDIIRTGAGDDAIIGGPAAATRLSTTTITVTGYGSVVGGVGAQARILVNGQQVSGVFEFKPAADPSAYQTMTVTFANPAVFNSLDIELMNATPGRALHFKTIAINGVSIVPADGTNASMPGTFDLYVHSIHFDAAAHPDWFFGASTDNDTIDAGAGNDVIAGGIGNDTIDGGDGSDTAVFAGRFSDYSIGLAGGELVVSDGIPGRDGTDHLTQIEFLKFADVTINAGNLAPDGNALQVHSTDLVGNVTNMSVRHADGSRDVYLSEIAGKDYVSEHDVIDSGGHTALIERFFADGSLAFVQTVNANGSVSRADYAVDGHLTKFLTSFADNSFDQFTFDAAGAVASETIRHADGSREIFSYGITDKDYASQHIVTDASGHSVLIENFSGDGSLVLKQIVDAGGVRTLDLYDGHGHLVQETVTQLDGSYVQSGYASDGTLATQTLRHADGSRDIFSYGITGKNYTSQHVVTDTTGHSVLVEQFKSDGSLGLRQTVDAAGTREIDIYQIAGQAYSARHDLIDAAGHRVASTLDNNDGSHIMTAYASGVALTSTAANDLMNSAGGDTFVFREASGHDVINNFKPGEGPGHDVIQIASSLAGDFAQLSIHVVGHDTVIDLGHEASITLTGVVAPLTPHDVLIV